MTTTATPTLSELEAAKAAADAEASKVSEQIAQARARAAEAEQQIQIIHRRRIEKWAKNVVDGFNVDRRDAQANVDTARKAFDQAVAAGDPEFLGRYLDLAKAVGHFNALHRRLSTGHYELRTPEPRIPDTGRHGQMPTLLDILNPAASRGASNLISDAEDATFREHNAVLAGELEDTDG